MIRNLLCVALLVLPVSRALAEEAKKAETPREAVAVLIKYLEQDDLEGFFSKRYGELDRFAKTEEEKAKIVAQLVERFARHKQQFLTALQEIRDVEPEIVQRGEQKVAIFRMDGKEKFALYLKDGIWTFHL